MGSYERLAFEKWGWLREPEVRGLYICMGMPTVSTVDTQGGGLNWFQFPVGSLPLSHTYSPSLCHIHTHAWFWTRKGDEKRVKHTLTDRDGFMMHYILFSAWSVVEILNAQEGSKNTGLHSDLAQLSQLQKHRGTTRANEMISSIMKPWGLHTAASQH